MIAWKVNWIYFMELYHHSSHRLRVCHQCKPRHNFEEGSEQISTEQNQLAFKPDDGFVIPYFESSSSPESHQSDRHVVKCDL